MPAVIASAAKQSKMASNWIASSLRFSQWRLIMAIKLHSSLAVHPGTWLRAEIVEPAGLSVTAAADRLHVSRPHMSNLLNGSAGLSAEMAIRFEKAFGLKAGALMRMQAAHELAEARKREDQIEVEAIAA